MSQAATLGTASKNDFDILDDLMRLILRAFYQPEHYVVVEILLREHRAVTDEELARRLKINTKQVRKYVSKLKDDHLLNNKIIKHEKFDEETGQMIEGKKWQQQNFYYIDYKHFVDVVKYRFYKMEQRVTQTDQSLECQGYFCSRCNNKYNALDAMSLLDPNTGTFRCSRCKNELSEEDNSVKVQETQSKKSTMLTQLKPIVDQLKKTEGIVIPSISLTQLVGVRKLEASDDGKVSVTYESSGIFNQDPKIEINLAPEQHNNVGGVNGGKQQVQLKSLEPVALAAPKISVSTEQVVKELPPWLAKQQKDSPHTQDIGVSISLMEEPSQQQQQAPHIQVIADKHDDYAMAYMNQVQQQVSSSIGESEEVAATTEETEFMEAAAEEEEDEIVKVGDKSIPFSQITQEDIDSMSPEEYQAYYEVYNRHTTDMSDFM